MPLSTNICPANCQQTVGKAAAGTTVAVGAGLGILSIVLALGLVGMVISWVWSCHKRRELTTLHERYSIQITLYSHIVYSLHSVLPQRCCLTIAITLLIQLML